MISIPERGRAYEEILDAMKAFRKKDADHGNGRTWSLVYHLSPGHEDFLKTAHQLFFSENALNPMAFQRLKRFEREVVRMAASLLHGGENTVGTMTS